MGLTDVSLEQIVQRGEQIAWVSRVSGRSRGADVPHEHRWGWRGRFAGGKLHYPRAYYEADEALADLDRST
jgi:hypothetical protein